MLAEHRTTAGFLSSPMAGAESTLPANARMAMKEIRIMELVGGLLRRLLGTNCRFSSRFPRYLQGSFNFLYISRFSLEETGAWKRLISNIT